MRIDHGVGKSFPHPMLSVRDPSPVYRTRTWLLCLAFVLASAHVSLAVATLADFWTGQAVFAVDEGHVFGNFSPPPTMHFLSSVWSGGQLWTYYIYNDSGPPTTCPLDTGRPAVGLALSPNGIDFANQGKVLDVGGAWQWVYDAIVDLQHQTGSPQSCGWSATVGTDQPGFLCFGPNATDVGPGPNTASTVLAIDDASGPNDTVVTLETYDASSDQVLTSRDVRRQEFTGPNQEQVFNLDYTQTAGHQIEFRTYWHGLAGVCERRVAVSQGQAPFFDDQMASFPGVWKDGNTWYLVYEGNGTECNMFPGDIGLATSSDGIHWIKDANNPILRHEQNIPWESVNIGTPSLWKQGSTWYLFYHGFDGTDVHIGVATGTSLHDLTRSAGNPLLTTADCGAWCAGTVGKRSITKEGDYYYMVFEGSTDQTCCPEHPDPCPNFACARWSSGVARSTDLLHWDFAPQNPAITQTALGFGFDGPEWVRTPDGRIHIYFRVDGNVTKRASLVSDCNGNGVADEEELNLQTIHVDRGHTGCENGTGTYPFNTVAEGYQASTGGDTVLIAAGTYLEELMLDRPITMRATGGVVRIGAPPNRSSATPPRARPAR